MKRLLALLALILSGLSAFSDEPDLVEGAKRAAAFWYSQYSRCSLGPSQSGAWYGVSQEKVGAGSIQMVSELRIQFKTEELSQEEKLNGFEFKARTSIEPAVFRWWIAPNKAWRDWQVGEMSPPIILIRRRGTWSTEAADHRTLPDLKAVATCSQIPPMNDERQ
jgi:hypothetical protein